MYSRILKFGVGGAEVDVHSGGEGPHGIVWCDADIVRLGNRGDFPHFEQSTAYTDVGLDYVCALRGDEIEKFKAGIEGFARR